MVTRNPSTLGLRRFYQYTIQDYAMISKVMFCNRKWAEDIPGRHNWVVISITETMSEDGPAVLQDGWHRILRLEFHDIDEEFGSYKKMTPEMAFEIVKFIRETAQEIDGVLVHCKAGISRSAAVAKWIADELSLPFDHNYNLHNKHVYKLLRDAAYRELQ